MTGGLLLFLYAAVLPKLGHDWLNDENYSHGLLIPFVIGFIVWTEFSALKSMRRTVNLWSGGSIIAVALLMFLAGTLGAELFVQRVSMVVMLAGVVIYFFGGQILRALTVPFLLLIFAIPIPQIIFNQIAFPLQLWASQIAIWGIRVFQVPSFRKGNVIEILPQGATQIVALEVVEACSGIRSLMTLVTLALVLWYFTREKSRFDWVRAMLLMLSAIPIAILTNAGRVTGTGVMTYYYGKKAADGFAHDFSGWIVYIIALVLLLGLNFALRPFFRNRSAADSDFAKPDSSGLVPNKAVFALVAVLLFGGVFINWFETRGEVAVERRSLKELPATLGDWTQKGSDGRFSEQTESILRTTEYVTRDYANEKGIFANLYIGYYGSQRTGATNHSPQNCMPGSGWEMKAPESVEITTPGGKKFNANRYLIINGNDRRVLVYWYQGRGRMIASEYSDKIYTVLDSITRRRSDGSMVRIITTIGSSESESLDAAVDLSAQIADNLSQFVPD